jgi:hypothetical protein
MSKTRVMLDLETLGTTVGSSIISVGAVKFGNNKIFDKFYKVVDMRSCEKYGLKIRARTLLWWLSQSEEARKEFIGESFDLKKVLGDFSYWVSDHDCEMWGNGVGFDNALLSFAYECVGINKPWNFRGDRCYRTIKSLFPQIRINDIGVKHNALNDAESQAIHLMEIEQSLLAPKFYSVSATPLNENSTPLFPSLGEE